MGDNEGVLAYDGFDALVGFVLDEATGDLVRGHLDVRPQLHQPFGLLHGGVLCTVAETAASVGGGIWFGERGSVVGVNNNTSFFRATREGRLSVEAVPVHRGRTTQVWSVTVQDAEQRLVAKGDVRLANLPAESDRGSA
ncbi:MAG TPA: PaaI family thioesterase [Mycobacteriales bacterium]|nr:PaaI family thioesterase [Mycobacteriales bacterium]